jgi:hypothetical protein
VATIKMPVSCRDFDQAPFYLLLRHNIMVLQFQIENFPPQKWER